MKNKKAFLTSLILSLTLTQIYANEGGKIMAGFYTWMMIFAGIGIAIVLWLIISIIKFFWKK